MLRRFWRSIQRFFRRLLGISSRTPPQTSAPTGTQQNSFSPVGGKGGKPQRTDIEYEVIFSELLEGVKQGWSRGNVLGFLIAKSIDDAELIAWLHRFAENLQATPEQHQELARRMVLLGEVYGKELGKVAGEIGKWLLAQVPQLDDVALGEVIEADATTDDAEVWFEQGYQQLMKGDFWGAIASFDKALAIQPDAHIAWYMLGVELGELGRFEEAIASFDKALAIQPDKHKAWYNRGVALDDLGQLEEEIASYEKALAIQPDLHQAWYNRGIALRNLGRIEEEIASYDKALAIQPDDYKAWYNRGIALGNLGRFEEAIASYEKALAIQPDKHKAWNNRGIELRNLGRIEEAIASYDKALAIQPDYYQAWNNRGIALSYLGRLKEAIASYNKALGIQSDYPGAWINRGLALDNLGRIEEAIASFDKALAIQPDDHQAWIYRGITAENLPEYNPQAAVILQMQFPQSPAVIPNPTLNQGGYEGALLCYQEGLKHCPQETHPEGWGMLHQYIGKAHYTQRKNAASEFYWTKAEAAQEIQEIYYLLPEIPIL
ncbi:MAG TPA: tetratricopeptide repeat protein [Leptolyngbyaceae cyanobacterium]